MSIRLRIAVMILLLPCHLMATTVVYVVSAHGIVIGADSKLVGVSLGGNVPVTPLDFGKTAVVQGRIVVASIGIDFADVWGKKENKVVFSYNFQTWVAGIEKQCPRAVSVSALTRLIKTETENTF